MLRYVIDCETNQRITAEEAGKKYSHNSTISAKSHSYRCGWCFHYVTLTSNAKIRDRYFKHSGNDEEKQCQDRQRRYGNDISIDTTLTTTGFNLSLRLIRREKTAHLEVVIPRAMSKRILEKHSDERLCIDRREYIIRERLSGDSNSYLRGDADISKSFEIKMPPGVEYTNPQLRDSGTFFLRSSGMMIRDFVREKEWYYLVSRNPIQNIHIQLDKDDPHIVVDGWHIYSVCINAYSETLAAHIQSIYGYHLMKYPVRCAPIWPTYYQDSDEYVFRSDRAYLYVKGAIDDLEPKQCALAPYLEGNLVTVDTDVQ